MTGDGLQGSVKADEACGAAGQAEAEQTVVPIEASDPDMRLRQTLMQHRRIGVMGKAVERRSPFEPEARAKQDGIQLIGLSSQALAHAGRPIAIPQCGLADGQRWPCNGPRAQRRAELCGDCFGGNGETKPDARQTVELAERSQNHDRIFGAEICGGAFRGNIDERLVDDQPTASARNLGGQGGQGGQWQHASVRIVRVDHDQVRLRGPIIQIGNLIDRAARIVKSTCMLVVGWAKNSCSANGCEARHPLDQCLRPGRSHEAGLLGHAVGAAGSQQQSVKIALVRQGLPEVRSNLRHRECVRVDAGGQIEPTGPITAKNRHRSGQIAAVQHHPCLPLLHSLRQSITVCAALLLMGGAAFAQALPPARVISLNMCTDQLLLDLAAPEQIAGLSPFAADAARSFMAARAGSLPILSGSAEEVMILKPDLVVAGTFTKRATREFIRARGVNLEEFAPVRTLAETRRQITRFGEITGARRKAAARNAELDAALVELRAAASAQKLRVLPLARRAWVSGSNSLMSELLSQAGLVNAAGELGIRTGARATLEQIVLLKPDAILISRDDGEAEDQGRALLLHPAIQSLFPPERRIVIPERLTVCGGPMLAEAMRVLAGQISRLKPREGAER